MSLKLAPAGTVIGAYGRPAYLSQRFPSSDDDDFDAVVDLVEQARQVFSLGGA